MPNQSIQVAKGGGKKRTVEIAQLWQHNRGNYTTPTIYHNGGKRFIHFLAFFFKDVNQCLRPMHGEAFALSTSLFWFTPLCKWRCVHKVLGIAISKENGESFAWGFFFKKKSHLPTTHQSTVDHLSLLKEKASLCLKWSKHLFWRKKKTFFLDLWREMCSVHDGEVQ